MIFYSKIQMNELKNAKLQIDQPNITNNILLINE